MKKLLTLLAVALIAVPALCSAQEHSHRCLNDIRFDGWTDEDWLNNDYIRTLRSYIDACYRGDEVCDLKRTTEDLDEQIKFLSSDKSKLNGENKRLKTKVSTLTANLSEKEEQISSLKSLLAAANSEIQRLNNITWFQKLFGRK